MRFLYSRNLCFDSIPIFVLIFRCVDWSLHNPRDGVYSFLGLADIFNFLDAANQEDMLVILELGPFISIDRQNGGIPFWLSTKYRRIETRSANEGKSRNERNL